MEIVVKSPDDLLLDRENPRLAEVQTQSAALEAIVMLSPSNFQTMMTSIGTHGLDPGDAFYLIPDDTEDAVTICS